MYCDPGTKSPRHQGTKGFSFIEVMIVVVIIGLLAGAVTLRFSGVMDTAKVTRARSDLATIKDGVELFYLHKSRYPTNEEGLDVIDLENRKDPWGNEYQYNSPGSSPDGVEPYEVFSLGADGREGGEGVEADIFSWNLQTPEQAE